MYVWIVVAGVSATPYEDNFRYFNVAIAGPADSPYEGKHWSHWVLWAWLANIYFVLLEMFWLFPRWPVSFGIISPCRLPHGSPKSAFLDEAVSP